MHKSAASALAILLATTAHAPAQVNAYAQAARNLNAQSGPQAQRPMAFGDVESVCGTTSCWNGPVAAVASQAAAAKTTASNAGSLASQALGATSTQGSLISSLQQTVQTLAHTVSVLTNQVVAINAKVTVTPSSNTATLAGAGGYHGTITLTSTSGTGTTPSFTPFNDGLPNMVLQIDPGEPTTQGTCTAAAACIQVDASTPPNVLGITDVVAGQVASHGYGELSLQLDTGLGLPYFHGASDSVNNAYDGVVYTPSTGATLVNPLNNAMGCLLDAVQLGDQATAFASFWGSQNLDWTGTTDPNGDTYIGIGSATIVEPASTLTAYNQDSVITAFSPDGARFCIGRGKTVSCGGTGTVGGIGGLSRTELLNAPNANAYYEECWAGYPGDFVMQTAVVRHESRMHITGDTATFTTPSPAAKAPLPLDLTNNFLTAPNFPVSDTPPTPPAGTTPTLPGGLTLAPGATYKAMYDFTPNGNVNTRRLLDQYFYYQSLYGNQMNPLGNDGIQGDTGPGHNWSQPRTYADGTPYNLLNFTSAGLNLGVICSQNNTPAGCTFGNIHGPLLRPTVTIQIGDIVHAQFQTGTSQVYYQALAEYGGVEQTPGPGSQNYPTITTDPNCYDEDDGWLDGYRIDSSFAVGQSYKIGVVPRYQYSQNTNQQCWKLPPIVTYAANGPNFTYYPNPSGLPYFKLTSANTSTGMHDYTVWRPNDGSNTIRYYFDGYLALIERYQQSPTNPGWFLMWDSQTVADFDPERSTALGGGIDCTTSIINGPCSATLAKIEVITGSISGVAKARDTNGANNDPISLN